MGSFPGDCEIVEAKEESSSCRLPGKSHQPRGHNNDRKLPLLKEVCSGSLEDDIDKLFEAINIKTSEKGPSSPDQVGSGSLRRNALKKPMMMGMSPPAGIGFSEPVSLKQALRGLCISQASEMAAIKRLSKPTGSPGVSEIGKITNLYRSVVVEASESGLPLTDDKGGKVEIALVPEESTSYSSEKMPHYIQQTNMKSNHSAQSSPRFNVVPSVSNPRQNEILPKSTDDRGQPSKGKSALEEKHDSLCSLPQHITGDDKINTEKEKLANGLDKKVPTTTKLANKAGPKVKRKGRLLSGGSAVTAVNTSKGSKPMRTAQRMVKPVIRNKSSVKKKAKQVSASVADDPSTVNEVEANSIPYAGQLVCQRCQCTLKAAREDPRAVSSTPVQASAGAEVSSINGNYVTNKPGFVFNGCDRSSPASAKTLNKLKAKEKGDFSQSSKSSIGDYSSCTSISEDSNSSGSSLAHKPHMSKDVRWEAIHNVTKQQGFLGLSHFNLLKKLGCGDIGTVYLAELIGTNCLFAIKVMDNEFLARRKKMPRAQTEREILRVLDHPFLPTLYAQFTTDNLSCLVMEFCPGGDLHVLRQKQPGRYFPEPAARFYVAEVLLALEYLHMLGVIYRDLKPENILVREDGHIMLTDFDLSLRCSVNPTLLKSSSSNLEPPRVSGPCRGSSCMDPLCMEPSCKVSCFSPRLLAASKTGKHRADLAAQMRSLPQLVAEPIDARSNSFVGTHEYLAPEIIKGDGHGSAVDWWTFGIFLYELLCGKTPFKGAGNEQTLANVVLQSLKFPDRPLVSFQARDLIQRLLVKEPENRFGSTRGAAEIKQHPFFHGLNWALIRCAVPPSLPEFGDIGLPKTSSQEKGTKHLEYRETGDNLEFELF